MVKVYSGYKTREVLTANRTYYVRTDGNDSNNGLTNTAGGAFLTPQKYYGTVAALDKNGYSVTGKLADGTYTITSPMIAKSGIGDGSVILEGNTTTPSNVVITTSTDLTTDRGMLYFDLQPNLHILKGFKLVSVPSVNQRGIYVRGGSKVEYESLDFGSFGGTYSNHIRIDSTGSVVCTGNYSITGGAGSHWFTSLLGNLLCTGRTITLTGTPAFGGDAFCSATRKSVCQVNANTFSGSGTGKTYNAIELSLIFATGTTLPGNISGTTATGGQYV
jgi:hypothetical protein